MSAIDFKFLEKCTRTYGSPLVDIVYRAHDHMLDSKDSENIISHKKFPENYKDFIEHIAINIIDNKFIDIFDCFSASKTESSFGISDFLFKAHKLISITRGTLLSAGQPQQSSEKATDNKNHVMRFEFDTCNVYFISADKFEIARKKSVSVRCEQKCDTTHSSSKNIVKSEREKTRIKYAGDYQYHDDDVISESGTTGMTITCYKQENKKVYQLQSYYIVKGWTKVCKQIKTVVDAFEP